MNAWIDTLNILVNIIIYEYFITTGVDGCGGSSGREETLAKQLNK
jgi:hypothetical protein